jgi:tetratricopeptide (TPR) repeat protein
MSVNLQAQIRDNSRDLNAFLRDLNEWTGDVKEKDAALSSGDARDVPASASSSGRAEPPPVRGRVAEHVVASEADLKARRKESRAAAPAPSPASAARTETPARDGSNDGAAPKTKTTTSLTHKDLGNAAFKTGEYESAIEHYTRSLQEDGETAVAYANRSMSYLKLERWAEAERDASAALKIDVSYLKAHQRRGVARRRLGKFLEATMDYENALLLEPNSKVLREDRAACKSAYERQANVRVTAARRAVPVTVTSPPR